MTRAFTVPNGGPGHSGLTEAFAKQTSPLHRLVAWLGYPIQQRATCRAGTAGCFLCFDDPACPLKGLSQACESCLSQSPHLHSTSCLTFLSPQTGFSSLPPFTLVTSASHPHFQSPKPSQTCRHPSTPSDCQVFSSHCSKSF